MKKMSAYALKNREVCWDKYLWDSTEGEFSLVMQKPVKKNAALVCDKAWESARCGWSAIMKIGDTYRLYYRTWGAHDEEGGPKEGYCIAESKDGKTFTRPTLCQYTLGGAKENNVFFKDESRYVDNFSVHYDENPDCPPDAKFKGLSLVFYRPPIETENGPRYAYLCYYKSADGISFEKVGILDIPGVFDTYNVVFWDKDAKEYKMYMRDFHNADGSTSRYEPTAAMEVAYRDFRLTTSKDFVHWSEPKMVEFSDGRIDIQHYTNQIYKYPRAEHMFVGVPVRYIKNDFDDKNFKYLPKWNGRRAKLIDAQNRVGTVATDCTVITSRDGFRFERSNEPFLAPELEKEYNWKYGEGYTSHRTVETASDENPEVSELSFYMHEENRHGEGGYTVFYRYTLRLDGYFSWHGDFNGGTVTTKPVIFEGDSLEINFKTSALGGVRIEILDENSKPIEGYDSGRLFGNSLSRPVDFDAPLSALAGKTVRLRITLMDADLYSFRFY